MASLRNSCLLTFSPLILRRLFVNKLARAEKDLSASVEEAWIQRYFLTRIIKLGNFAWFFFQYWRGSSSRLNSGSLLYLVGAIFGTNKIEQLPYGAIYKTKHTSWGWRTTPGTSSISMSSSSLLLFSLISEFSSALITFLLIWNLSAKKYMSKKHWSKRVAYQINRYDSTEIMKLKILPSAR